MQKRQPPVVFFFGRTADGSCVVEATAVPALAGKSIAGVGAAWKHSLAVARNGDVYSWGWGQGTGHGLDSVAHPRLLKTLTLHRVLTNVRFVQAAGGADFSLAVSELGMVWSFGGNGEGQLGAGAGVQQPLPRLLLPLSRVKVAQVACGGWHCLARTDAGSVWSWGRGGHGALGHGDEQTRATPVRVRALANVALVACGWSHSLCVDTTGRLWTFGKGTEGQLGLGRCEDAHVPQNVDFFTSSPPLAVVAVAGGYGHSCVLAGPRREAYTFGWGEHGQLGHGDQESTSDPRPVQALFGLLLESVACGGYHTLALTQDGCVYGWGESAAGQLGLGSEGQEESVVPTPRRIPVGDSVVSVICAGPRHSLLVATLDSGSSGMSHSSSRESMFSSEDEDMRSLKRALQKSEEGSLLTPPTIGIISAPAPGTVTVQGVVLVKPPPAPDTQMKPGRPSLPLESMLTVGTAGASGLGSSSGGGGGSSGAPGSSSSSPRGMVRVSSFLQNLFSLDGGGGGGQGGLGGVSGGSSGGAADVLPPDSAQESQRAAAADKADEHWRKEIMPEWETLKRRGKLGPMVLRGVPLGVRGEVWKLCIGNELGLTEETWEEMRLRSHELRQADPQDRPTTFRMIEVDLPRTFPRLQLFQANGPMHEDLMEVLEAFAVYREDLGYVQGMSFVAAMLMLQMNQVDTFICLCNVLNSHFFESLYRFNIRECLKHIRIYELLFSKHLPGLYSHFQALGVSPEHYLLDWFFSIFSRSLPLTVAVRVWDGFFQAGEVFLFQTALALLKAFEPELLQSNLEQIVPLLRKLPEDTEEVALFRAIAEITVPRYIHQFIQRILTASLKKRSEEHELEPAHELDDGPTDSGEIAPSSPRSPTSNESEPNFQSE